MAATSIRATALPNASIATDAVLAIAGAALISLAAQISIALPFTPVPITGQTLAVTGTAAVLGLRTGTAASILYALAGCVGLPVFADGKSGFHILTGATGGYIVGFVVCAACIGWCSDRGWTAKFSSSVGAMLLGETIVYAFGVLWLRHSLGVSLERAFELGLYPFVVGDLLKVYLAAALLPAGHRAVAHLRRRD